MVLAMLLAGLRRCEVLGLRAGDLRFAKRRIFIAAGKGCHQRLVPVSPLFFTGSAPTSRLSGRPRRPPMLCSPCSRAAAVVGR
jgi:integrase